MTQQMTRERLAALLESEAENAAADQVRCGANPAEVCRSLAGKKPRYTDFYSRNARAIFTAVAAGEESVTE